MKVYELMVDEDMTTRSTTQSYGLFSTFEKAEARKKQIMLTAFDHAYYEIVEREVE